MTSKKELVSSNGGREIHAILTVDDPTMTLEAQLLQIGDEFAVLCRDAGARMKPVFCRWMLSDAANQCGSLPDLALCAVSVVEQAPLSLTKAALWVWLMEDVEVEKAEDGVFMVRHLSLIHISEPTRH